MFINFNNSKNSYVSNIESREISSRNSDMPKSQRAEFSKTAKKEIDTAYQNYFQSLQQVSLKDVIKIVDEVAEETNTDKSEVLNTMQKITQFGNINSLKTITNQFNKDKISSMNFNLNNWLDSDCPENFLSDVDNSLSLNTSLSYLITEKKLGVHNRFLLGKTAVFLDEDKINDFERLKEKYPESFEELRKSKKLKFYFLSGFDNGVTFFDRTKSLKDVTKELINKSKLEGKSTEEIIDKPYLDRIRALGINPQIIKCDAPSNALTVYNQLKNPMMTKSELYNLVEANTLVRKGCLTKKFANGKTAEFLKENLYVFSPEKMSKMLKEMHEKITDYAKERNIDEKDIVYLYSSNRNFPKSDVLINHFYKKINNIPKENFRQVDDIKSEKNLENKLLVFLDDCSISGASVYHCYEHLNDCIQSKDAKGVLFANLITSTSNEKEKFFKNLKQTNPKIDEISIETVKPSNRILQEKILGQANFCQGGAFGVILPYMSPDNNVKLAANIAIIHNPNFTHGKMTTKQKGKSHVLFNAVKNIDLDVMNVLEHQTDLIGYEPE